MSACDHYEGARQFDTDRESFVVHETVPIQAAGLITLFYSDAPPGEENPKKLLMKAEKWRTYLAYAVLHLWDRAREAR
jgi:3-methyladenine DNA glycosylase/8-oxoguanine DNA glycosylase